MLKFGIERIHLDSLSGKIMIYPYVNKCAQHLPLCSLTIFRLKSKTLVRFFFKFQRSCDIKFENNVTPVREDYTHARTYIHISVDQNEKWVLNLPDFCRVSPLSSSRVRKHSQNTFTCALSSFSHLHRIFFNNI